MHHNIGHFWDTETLIGRLFMRTVNAISTSHRLPGISPRMKEVLKYNLGAEFNKQMYDKSVDVIELTKPDGTKLKFNK